MKAPWRFVLALGSSDRRNACDLAIGSDSREEGDDSRLSALIGAIWRHMDNLSFDIAIRAIREDGTWSRQGRIGITWAFAVARS